MKEEFKQWVDDISKLPNPLRYCNFCGKEMTTTDLIWKYRSVGMSTGHKNCVKCNTNGREK